jgi:hypothetical protein
VTGRKGWRPTRQCRRGASCRGSRGEPTRCARTDPRDGRPNPLQRTSAEQVEEWTTAIPLFHLTRAPQSAFVNSARLHCETRFDHGKGASGADRIYESQAAVHQAEYGRSVGGQISLVTKSGTERYMAAAIGNTATTALTRTHSSTTPAACRSLCSGWHCFFLRPFDQKPFFRIWPGCACSRDAPDARGQPRTESVRCLHSPVAPPDFLPGRGGQAER